MGKGVSPWQILRITCISTKVRILLIGNELASEAFPHLSKAKHPYLKAAQ